jgi:hypothetical protein
MNYIQIEMNGQKVGLKFAFPQAKEFAIALAENADLYFEGENITTFGIAKLLQTAYKNNCLVKEIKPTFTLEDFTDFIDESSDEWRETVLLDILTMWQDSKYTKLWVEALKKKTAEILEQTAKNQKTSKASTKKLKQPSTQAESGSGS